MRPHTYIELSKLNRADFRALVRILQTRYGKRFVVSKNRQMAQAEVSQMFQEIDGDMSAIMVRLFALPFAVYEMLQMWFREGKWEPAMPPRTIKAKESGDGYFWMASTFYSFAGLKRSYAFIDLWEHLPNRIEEVPRLTLLIVYVMLQGEKMRPEMEDIIALLRKCNIPGM